MRGMRGCMYLTMLALLLALAACDASPPPPEPFAVATAALTPTTTPGALCSGGPWKTQDHITSIGANIPLPPQTLLSFNKGEPTPPQNGWTMNYLALCTPGNLDTINTWVSTQMPANGWVYGPPPASCLCNGQNVWMRQGDPRLIQFEDHMALVDGDVHWGITIITHV